MSLFFFESAAVDNASKYRPLANGWVSWYAEVHLDPSLSILEKFKKIVEADLVHGRFRPAFSYFSTISYALSPVIHDRDSLEENRNYLKLINGDLQLNNIILLISLAIIFSLLSVLVLRYTGSVVFALVPLFFIPLSPSLTENLLQNYIDSQEIPLTLWMSLWMFFLFTALSLSKNRIVQNTVFSFSIIFLILTLLSKETTIVVLLPILLFAFITFIRKKNSLIPNQWQLYSMVTLIFSLIGTIGIIAIVTMHKQGYSSVYYEFNFQEIFDAINKLWICISMFSLHNTYGFILIGSALLILFTYKDEKFNGIPVNQHILLALFFLTLCYGSLFILIPWKPILIKYVLPSVIFFSFLVAYSTGVVAYWFRERTRGILKYSAYLLVIPFIVLFINQQGKAASNRNYLFALANFGINTLDEIVSDIDLEVKHSKKNRYNIFVGFEAEKPWKSHIEWSTLHISRLLNLDHHYNIIDGKGTEILQIVMPKGELTSYRYNSTQGSIFLSDSLTDLDSLKFDIVFRGYKRNDPILDELAYGGIRYKKFGIVAENPKRYGLAPFKIVKYIPLPDES